MAKPRIVCVSDQIGVPVISLLFSFSQVEGKFWVTNYFTN